MLGELFTKPTIIFGCGNILLGDDGFGPAVVEHLNATSCLPDSVFAVDVGTSLSDLLFDFLLANVKPFSLFIVDAASLPQYRPGELFELGVEQLPDNKSCDFSLHQFPAVNLLKELKERAGVKVRILAVQAKEIPEAVCQGLSPEVEAAVPIACRWLLERLSDGAEISERHSHAD